ncbi:hypothetical protein RNM01_04555 [Mesomycoplasma ovipneumoniae]|nr:hypothetical protein [Mesomycoplasma ovipneumoniae]WNM14988.1 hypothetical protein RNM01_04555 [Mesomycoplasma ovipneumoniae]
MIDLLNKKVNILINLLYEFTKKILLNFRLTTPKIFIIFKKLEEDMSVKIAHLKSKNASRKREMEVFYDNFKNYDENTENNTNDFCRREIMKNTIFKVLPNLVFSSSIFFNLSAIVEPNYIKKINEILNIYQ